MDVDPVIHWGGGEDPPGPRPQVPGQQHVPFDVGDGQVVTALTHRALLAHEQEQGNLGESNDNDVTSVTSVLTWLTISVVK